MSNFDSPYSDPFESLDLVDIQTKSYELTQALDEKIKGLELAKERQLLRQKTYQETLSGILGLDPEGAIAAPVNTVGGSLLDAGQQTVKFLGNATLGATKGLIASGVDDEDYAAYSRIQQGKGKPEDFTRMQEMRTTPGGDATAADLFKGMEKIEQVSSDLTEYFDSYKLRGTGNSQALQEASDTPETRDALAKLSSGNWSDPDKGKIASIIGFSKEIGALVKEAVKAGGDNPVAVFEEALVNAAPIIMATVGGLAGTALLGAYTSGYAAETYNKAVQKYQKENGGTYPDAARRAEMLLQASSLAAAEFAGSVLTASAAGLGKLPAIAAMGARGAGKEVAESALKSILKAGGVSIARVGEAVGSEAATEGFQTYQEGELMGAPASALDIYTGAVIGGLTGGAMATPAAVAGTVLAPAKAAAEARRVKAEEKEKRKAELAEYVATGDVSAFFDPASDKYDIRTGMEVLQVIASDANKDADTRQAAVAKAQEMFDTLTDQRKTLKKELSAEGIVETSKAEVEENLAATKEYVEEALKENPDMPIEGFNKEIARLETALTKIKSPEIVEKLERLKTLTAQITETQPLLRDMDNVTTKAEVQATEEELVPVTPKAKSKTTLIRSITSTDALTPQEALELADDTENDLTDNERVYLRKFSEARISQNKLMTLKGVSNTIFNGDDQFGNLSLPDYRARMARAINAGNQEEQVKLQGMLGKWVNHHTNKLATAKAMYASLKDDKDVKYIVANEDGTWTESPRALTGKERDSSGSMEIRRNYSKNVIPVMEEENVAMQAAYQELVAMVNASTTSQEAQEEVDTPAATQASVVADTPVEQAPTSKTPVFDTLPVYVPGQKTMTYAGVGSRKTPPNVMAKMTEVAAWLAKQGYTLRSGNAKGADTAFENGAGEKKEIFTSKDATDTTRAIAKEIHPNPSALGEFAIDLMARNTNQIFGENLDSPVDFVLVWTPDGAVSTETRSRETGGTGQAIDMASRKGIPVINMANKGWGEELRNVLKASLRTEAVSNTTEQAPEVNTPKPASTEVGLPEGTVVTESLLQILATLMAGKTQPNVKQKALRELEATYPDVYAIVDAYMQDNTVAFGKSDKRIQALWKQAKDIGAEVAEPVQKKTAPESEPVQEEAVRPVARSTPYPDSVVQEVVYHTTNESPDDFTISAERPADSNKFWVGGEGINATERIGFYLTGNKSYSQSFGNNTIPMYVNLKNPYLVKDNDSITITQITRQQRDELIAKGYDGLLYEDPKFRLEEIVVFSPNQVAFAEPVAEVTAEPEAAPVQTEEVSPIPVREDMPEITRADPVEAKKSTGTLDALNAETGWGSLFVQQAPEQESPQPLMAVKDFMSQWEANPNLIFDFIEETEGTTTPEQNHAIKVFKETMKAWMSVVDTLLVEVKPEFIQDAPFMIFTNKQKDAAGKEILVMEENVKAAVVAAVILHIQNEGGQTYRRTQKDINLLLGRDKDAYVSTEEFDTYRLIGDHRQTVIDNLAMSVSSLLGLDIKPNVPQQTKAIMDTALGSLALRLLMEVGSVAQRDESISSRVDGSKADPYITFANVWDKDNSMNMRIATSSQGSNSILHRLLGTENMVVEPTLKPQKTTQRDMQKQFQEASDVQLEHLNEINKVENFVDGFMMVIMKKLSPTGQDKVIGVQWDGGENGEYIQKTRIKGIQGANDSLRRNLQNAIMFFDTVLKGDDEKPFFLKNVPWTQGRAGIAQTVLNPNADKTARRLVTRRSWKSKIDLRNPVAVNGFMIAVASALGIDIDKMSHEKAMEDLMAELGWDGNTNGGLRLTNPIYADAIEAIRDVVYNARDGFTPEQEKAIGLAVDANSDHMHALQALAALAEMEAKITDNADDFITTLTLEVDGVTNGPMLTMLLWGTYGDPRSLERGGFFLEGAKHENYNEWRGESTNSDLYEDNAKDMVKVITTMGTPREKEILSAAYVVTGNLVDDGKATSATRKLVKLPLTQCFFGSGMETVRKTVVNSFVESMYEKLEKAVLKMWSEGGSGHDLRMLEKAINALLTDGVNNYGIDLNGKAISDNRGEFWLNFQLSPKQFDVLKNNIDSTLGEAMEQTLSLNFTETLVARKAITTASSMMYSTYMAAYNYLRRLALKGANRDLTKEEEARLFERLKPMLPKMHTAYSKVSGNSMEAALPMFGKKARQVMHDDDAYRAAIKMAPFTEIKHNKIKKAMVSYGSAKLIAPPSVRAAPMGIHSLDGKTSQDAQKGTEALNNHDAHLTGIEAIEIQTRRMNESLWNNLLDYSPMREMADGLLRTLEGFNQVLESFADKPEIQRGLKNAFIESLPTYTDRNTGDDVRNVAKVGNVLNLINTLADQADYAKLTFMASLSAINQYGFQGGSYLPTTEDRNEALKRRNALLSELDWRVSAQFIVEALFKGVDHSKINNFLVGFNVKPVNIVGEIIERKSLGIVEGIHGALEVSNQQNTRIYEMLGMLIDAVRGNATAWNNLSQLEKDVTAQYATTQTIRNAQLNKITSVSEALPDTQMEVTEGMDKQELAVEPVDMQVTLPDTPKIQTTFGFSPSIGTPTSVQNTELAALLNSKLEVDKADFLEWFALSNQNGFYRLLLKRITGMLPDFKVVTLTAETIKNLPKEVVFAPGEYAKYVSLGDGSEVIYVLGEDFKNSNITHATLMHEMVHAALSRAMEDNPEFTKELQQFMAEVKAMLTPAQQKHPAFANVDEFLTYGLTDRAFQAVLNDIKFPTPTGVVEAIRSFVNILLKGLGLDARHDTALKRLITLGAEVIDKAEAAHRKETKSTIIRNISVTADKVRDYSTEDIFNALDTGAIDTGFRRHLRNVLNNVVAKLYGPYGALGKEAMRQQPMGALDVYLNGLGKQGGVFTSEILMSDIQISEQERFVAEQVEATVRAALEDNTAHTNGTYAQLARMYMEAAKRFPSPEKMIDWAKASPTEKDQATALHKFLFDLKQTESGKSNHLARFAAMVLAVEGTSRMFGYASKNRDRTFDTSTLMGRMLTWFDSVLDWFDSRVSATYVGQRADEKVMALVTKLAEIEAKRRQRVYARNHSKTIADTVDEGVAYLNDQTRSKVLKFSRSKVFRNSKNVYMRVAGSTLGVLSRDAIDEFGETLRKFASYASKDKTNMAAALITELRGDTDSTSIFYKLIKGTKHIETTRQQMITNMSNMLNRSFLGHKKFGKAHNEAITTYAIRTGMYTLMDKYSLVEIEQMLSNKALLVKAIEAHEQELMTLNSTFAKFWIVAGKSLGHKMTTGVAKFQMVANPYIIARGGGTQIQDNIPTNVASQAEPIIDRLASLQAMLSGPNTFKEGAAIKTGARDLMASIMREENARTDGNGVETVLKMHKKQMEDSKAKLFKDSEALMVKGYSPDMLNPHVEFEVGTATEGDRYLKLGYKRIGKLAKDPNDPSKEEKFIYARKGSGLRPWQSGIFSFTSMGSRGSKQLGENLNPFTVAGNINRVALDNVLSDTQRSMSWTMKGAYTGFDPAAVKESYMVPVFNADMSVVNFRYEMTENMKDTTLERDNRFAHILGTLEGNIFDKVTSPEQNKAAAQALYDHYQANKAMDSKSFVYVGFDSQDPELAGIANMFPERTRQDIRKIWGTNGMMVRKDLLDMNFGYRKWSAAEALFQSAEEKNQFAKFIVGLFEVMFGGYDEDSKKIARERAKQWLLNKGDIWEAMVSEAKDIIVVKTGIVLLNNITSNFLELKAFGVPTLDIIRHHRTAIKASIAYRKDREELFELENLVAAGLTQGKDAEINRKIVVLKDAIVSSPVHRLMEEGLMPTIVEDVASNEDIYSRKSELVQKLQKYTKRVPAPLVKAARFTYMAHDTFLYRTLSEATQLSDFVARYTLYQHEVNKKKKPLTHDEAVRKVSDAFINYDIPSHRKLQWGNDMGLVMFTKYYIRIQKVILRTMRDSPGNALAMLMLNQYMDSLPMLYDSGILGNSYGGGLFGSGALELPYALDDLMTVDAVL